MGLEPDDDEYQPSSRFSKYDRRQHRAPVPECPTCHCALEVQIRTDDTLYASCRACGHRETVDKLTRPTLL